MAFSVYMLASRRNGTLYTGVTNDLGRRLEEHRGGRGSQFAKRYGVTSLVWAESYDLVVDAIAAEKRIKAWRRAWKVALIERSNPDWKDISGDIH